MSDYEENNIAGGFVVGLIILLVIGWIAYKLYQEWKLGERNPFIGTIDNDDLELFSIIDDDDEIIRTIRTSPVREYLPYNGLKVNPIE